MDTKHLILLYLLSAGIVLGCETKQETTEASDLATVEATPPDRVHRAYETISLLGDTLYSDEMLTMQPASEDSAAHAAEQAYANAPTLPNTLALGKSLAHRSQFQDAIRVCTQGLAAFPDSPELYRHRGQQYITVRQFDRAVKDLEKSITLLKNRPVSAELEEVSPSSPVQRPASLRFEAHYWAWPTTCKGNTERRRKRTSSLYPTPRTMMTG